MSAPGAEETGEAPANHPPSAGHELPAVAVVAPLVAALALWLAALPGIEPDQMTDIGLVSVLPPFFLLALLLLLAGFCLAVFAREPIGWMPAAYIAAWIVVIHATPAIVYGSLRYAWAWKHVGIVEYIQRTGQIDPSIAYLPVYHDWPGFFGAAALIVESAGVNDALLLARWAPVAFELLFAAGVLLLLRGATADWRLIWLGVWFFSLTNWVGQDYFAPQAMVYLCYLAAMGICLWAFPLQAEIAGHPVGRLLSRWRPFARLAEALDVRIAQARAMGNALPALSIGQQRGVLGIVLILLAAIAVSHQLTPILAIMALAALVILGLCRVISLPVIMGVFTAAWLVTAASTFAAEGLRDIVASFGQTDENVGANLIDASKFTPGFRIVSNMARGLTAAVGLLAILGWIRRYRQGYLDPAMSVLWVVPVGLLAVSNYGGEILFRVFFFALPFMAFYMGALAAPALDAWRSWPRMVLTAIISLALATAYLFAYFGHEQSNYFRPGEVAAAEYLDQISPEGTLLVEVTPDYPSRFRRYEQYVYVPLVAWPRGNVEESENAYSLEDIVEMMRDPARPAAYFVVTDGQLLALSVPGLASVEAILDEIASSDQFTPIFENDHATIYALAGNEPEGAP